MDKTLLQLLKKEFPLKTANYPKIKVKKEIGEYVINRYPLLACIGYIIAKEKYPEKTAKSLGIALANQYACWKNTRGYFTKSKIEKPNQKRKWQIEKEAEIINFCGESFVMKDEIILGAYYRKVWKKAEPREFDIKVIERFNQIKKNGFEFICQKIKEELNKLDPTIRNGFIDSPSNRLFFPFWKKVRDKLRSRQLWQI